MQTYLVGGAVRDELLDRPVQERDWLVVGATREEMLERGYRQVGKDFPVFLHPHSAEEYALARSERKTGPGYHGFQIQADPGVRIEEDLLRRDLTINAMARSAQGELIDPYGGLRDLHARQLRHVSPAFAEDPVRILRTARFAARYAHLGFEVAADTLTLMRHMVQAGEVDALVPERVWQELVKALAEQTPSRFFLVLRECTALKSIFPEIDALFGIPQPARHHPEIDAGIHSLMVLEQSALLSSDPRTRFAALTHDLGKATSHPADLPAHHGHEERGVKRVGKLCKRLKAPTDYRQLAEMTARYHGHIHKADVLRPTTILNVLHHCDALRRPERFEEMLLACTADYRGRQGYEDRPYPQANRFRLSLDAARQVDTAKVIASIHAPSGEVIRQAIHKARLLAIRQALG
jgi:tRNA nucleotidyltransferase (CCA-adding enzyme)